MVGQNAFAWMLVFRISFSSSYKKNPSTLASHEPYKERVGFVHSRCLMGPSESASRCICLGCIHVALALRVGVPKLAC